MRLAHSGVGGSNTPVEAATPHDRIRLALALAVLDATRLHRSRVRCCGRQACVLLFFDTSKNSTRRWCDMAVCGNRVKAAAHYERHRPDAPTRRIAPDTNAPMSGRPAPVSDASASARVGPTRRARSIQPWAGRVVGGEVADVLVRLLLGEVAASEVAAGGDPMLGVEIPDRVPVLHEDNGGALAPMVRQKWATPATVDAIEHSSTCARDVPEPATKVDTESEH